MNYTNIIKKSFCFNHSLKVSWIIIVILDPEQINSLYESGGAMCVWFMDAILQLSTSYGPHYTELAFTVHNYTIMHFLLLDNAATATVWYMYVAKKKNRWHGFRFVYVSLHFYHLPVILSLAVMSINHRRISKYSMYILQIISVNFN